MESQENGVFRIYLWGIRFYTTNRQPQFEYHNADETTETKKQQGSKIFYTLFLKCQVLHFTMQYFTE